MSPVLRTVSQTPYLRLTPVGASRHHPSTLPRGEGGSSLNFVSRRFGPDAFAFGSRNVDKCGLGWLLFQRRPLAHDFLLLWLTDFRIIQTTCLQRFKYHGLLASASRQLVTCGQATGRPFQAQAACTSQVTRVPHSIIDFGSIGPICSCHAKSTGSKKSEPGQESGGEWSEAGRTGPAPVHSIF